MKATGVVLWLAVVCSLSTGCESLGGGLDIVNETGHRLYSFTEVIQSNGGRWRYTTNDCSEYDLKVHTKDGEVFAELTEEWCPGQTWTITGKDESSLTG